MKQRKRIAAFVLAAAMLFSVLLMKCIGGGNPNSCRRSV